MLRSKITAMNTPVNSPEDESYPCKKKISKEGKAMQENVPISQKTTLTIREAAKYSNIGINRIESMLKENGCPFCLRVGRKRLVKRQAFEEFLNSSHCV